MTFLQPSLGVGYPLTPQRRTLIPLEVEIRQNEFMHDMAIIRYVGADPSSGSLRSGNPVRITYGYRGQQLAEFCGYVLWAKVKQGKGRDRRLTYTDVVCQGASRKMGAIAHRVHTSLTVNQILRQVSRDYKFDILRGNLNERWGRVVNPGKSDFSHLMAVAKRKGHVFYVHNATVCMYDPIEYITKHRGTWPVLRSASGVEFRDVISYDGTVSDSGGALSATMPVGTQYVGYIDPTTGEAAMQANTGDCSPHGDDIWVEPDFDNWVDDQPVEDTQEAAMVAEGAALANRWRHSMKIQAYGNQRVHQGTGVVLDGISQAVNGLWYVKSTKHVFHSHETPTGFRYFMDLDLLRDSRTLKTVPQPKGPVQRREQAATGLTVGLANLLAFDSEKTGPVLHKGVWVSNHPLRETAA